MANVLDKALTRLHLRADCYALFRAYYNGQHRLAFATEKFRNAFGNILQAFADNLTPVVIDAVADRLEVTEFQVEEVGGLEFGAADAGSVAEAREERVRADLDKLVRRVWRANRMDQRAGEVHQEALTLGDSYVIVWPSQVDGFPRISPQRGDAMTVAYDREDPNLMLWAAKVWWQEDKRVRLTLYYADSIEKWVTTEAHDRLPTDATAFQPAEVPGEPWPLPNPFGRVPVFHFSNNSGIGQFGRSELHDVIPLQDGLNKSVLDLLVAMEFVALPQRFVTGLELEEDDLTGKPKIPFRVGVDRLWQTSSPEARFGEFPGADLSSFVAVQKEFREEIARVTGTPLHYFSLMTDPPSGVALRALEARFVKRVRDRQTSYGNVWEDVMAFSMLILGQRDVRLSAVWVPAEVQDEKEKVETLLAKRDLGVSRRQALREAGYTDEQIAEMEAERQEEREALGGALLREFDQGRTGEGGEGGGSTDVGQEEQGE